MLIYIMEKGWHALESETKHIRVFSYNSMPICPPYKLLI